MRQGNVRKLTIFGHVHNRPEEKISSYYSWPMLESLDEAFRRIRSFSRAFTLLHVEFTSESR